MKFKTIILLLVAFSVVYAQDKRKIGLIPFENKTGDSRHEWVSSGLDYLLMNKLSVISGFYVPEKSLMRDALKEAGYGTRALDGRMSYHFGKASGAEVAITGSYTMNGQTLNLLVSYYNTFNGSLIITDSYNENISNLFSTSRKIIDRVVTIAGIGISPMETNLINRSITSSIGAFESFVRAYMENENPNGRMEVITGLFRKAIREDPKFWEAYYNLGIVYFNSKKYDEAIEQFNSVITALPNFDKPYYGRGLIYEKQKKYNLAIDDFKKVTEFNPNDFKPYYYLGKISVLDKNFKDAQTYLDKAQSLNPDYAPIYFEMGNIYYDQNLYRKSIEYYKKATELDNNNVQYHLILGETYYRSQIYYNALTEFNFVLSLQPNEPIANFMLGVTIYKQAVLEELIDAFLDILAEGNTGGQEVTNNKFSKNTGIDPVKKRKVYEDMVDAFTKASQAQSNFMEATFNLALTYFEMGNYELAERYFKATVLINPYLIRAYMKLAEVYEKTKRLDLAIEQYKKVFEIEPSIFVSQPTLGPEHQYINIFDRFMRELDGKLKANPNDTNNNLILAKVFQAQGYYGKAANVLRKVLNMSPNNNEAKNLLTNLEKYTN